ncbi:bifunctional 4-hydroxy-2-oxoglutarate aldolase/2-dehydro-3-deoxy-phosphogluconate aldolase [Teredinibacter turnerae]|uniref:2-dehydro-3-deoxy-phosphogluconate aldolase n=1 Tax=Teredinibacter turnerae (strain ATCC 39867 / T7901) TaxID=377629 RepID=C5BQ50_TERTT|nr:bifunctional 4-hydroxy-2-oxoglutarate aldolase/2-dehydro-3-deoxy-phosphogluconate aldolase [Teredinibacter turnerae]ACR14015.1 khg/kdpg aldolase family protein [Teredinibacter turnerae T7901]
MHAELEKIAQIKVVPVVAIDNADDAAPLAKALVAGGLPCAEVTFRTDAALESMKRMAELGTIQVGAGTVSKVEQVKAAVDAGATFMVSPGFNPKVVDYCVTNGIPIAPGITNPTDIEMALDFDLEVLKFFPAEAFGGVNTLKALSGPYGNIKFIPTGGIGANNLLDYLSFPKVIACGGSWMVKGELIKANNFAEIERLTKEAVELANSL